MCPLRQKNGLNWCRSELLRERHAPTAKGHVPFPRLLRKMLLRDPEEAAREQASQAETPRKFAASTSKAAVKERDMLRLGGLSSETQMLLHRMPEQFVWRP